LSSAIVEAFDVQARICRGIGSPLYADLLEHCVADLAEAASPLARLLEGWTGDLARDFVPLRVLGGVHALVLEGRAPELSSHYPSVGGTPHFPGCWRAFRATVSAHEEELRAWLDRVPQTNEVQRSASLLGGFLAIAQRFSQPLRLRELGASAGLNLLWNEHAYTLGPHRWGEPNAALHLRADWDGPAPDLDAPVSIEGRAGCDRHPIDLRDPAARRRLEAYFWADQVDRLERLRAAVERFLVDPPRLDRAEAPAWLAAELERGWPDGVCLVVFHSSFWGYLSDVDRAAIRDTLEQAGSRASESRPLAWLSADDDPPSMSLRLTCWPGGREERLARVHPHGRTIHWKRRSIDGKRGSTPRDTPRV
jgi:hypothetical protein